MYRTAEAAEVKVPGREAKFYVVLPVGVPEAGAHERSLREAALSDVLHGLRLPFTVPRVVAVYKVQGHGVLIEGAPRGCLWRGAGRPRAITSWS